MRTPPPVIIVHYLVDKLHVGTSDDRVIAEVAHRFRKFTETQRTRAIERGLRRHHANQKLYRYVMGGTTR